MARSVVVTLNYTADQKEEMAELINRVSNGPDSFFDGKAVILEGCGDCPLCLITCERGVGRNGRVGRLSIK